MAKVKRVILASNPPVVANVSTVTTARSQEEPVQKPVGLAMPSHFYLNDSWLNFNGYVIEKKTRKTLYEEPSRPQWIDMSYIEITKDKRVVAKFDADVYFGLGNSVDFGWFPFIGEAAEQLFISQDIPRAGRQWIVSLSSGLRVIFDGDKYSVGREGYDLSAIDLDKDGVKELAVPLTQFYGFHNLSPAATPLPTIIFKYNAKAREYLPANHQFRDYLLRDIEKQKAAISPVQDTLNNHLSDVMSITLDYIFAGEEQKAWTFFDDSYKLPDKKKIKAEIKAEIKDHPVYRLIYQKSSIH